jgi:hypothetical protein
MQKRLQPRTRLRALIFVKTIQLFTYLNFAQSNGNLLLGE